MPQRYRDAMKALELTVRMDPAALRQAVTKDLTQLGYRVKWRDETHAAATKRSYRTMIFFGVLSALFMPRGDVGVRLVPDGEVCRLRVKADLTARDEILDGGVSRRAHVVADHLAKTLNTMDVLVAPS